MEVRVFATLTLLGAVMLLHRQGMFEGTVVADVVADSANNGPNEMEMDIITKNYYEQLVDVDRDPEWNFGDGWIREWLRPVLGRRGGGQADVDGVLLGNRVNGGSIALYGATEDLTEGFLEHRFLPDISVINVGVPVQTNRWGHRDDDNYDKEKPPGVFRIALVGSSNSMGNGVRREEVFELHVERMLNEELAGGAYDRYEIINFSVPRYHLLERVYVAEEIAPEFHPDLILVEVTMRDLRTALYESSIRRLQSGRDLHFDFLKDIISRAHVSPSDSETKIRQRLQRFTHELAASSLHHLRTTTDALGIPTAMLVLRLEVEETHDNLRWIADAAEREGLVTLRIFDAYEGQTAIDMYQIPNGDFHPTARGHEVLADEIYDDLLAHPITRRLLTEPPLPENTEDADGG
jgi:hypothetical protein